MTDIINQEFNMAKTITIKSDQLNGDDLRSGPITVRIRDIKLKDTGDQPCSIFYDGDNNKPFKPCLGMRVVITDVWGFDAKKYIGRSMTLFRDEGVVWAGMEVGGVRISHMSNITEARSIPITKTRGKKVGWPIKPLITQVTAPSVQPLVDTIAPLKKAGAEAAGNGTEALKAWWAGIGAGNQKAVGAEYLAELKQLAEAKNKSDGQ